MKTPVYLLVLEDDVRVSEMIRQHLQSTLPQITPLFARTIAEAHVFIYQYEFNAFLIDLVLPDGNGLEFIVDLKTVMPDAELLIMTGMPSVEIEPHLQQLGRHHYFQKPFDMLELERVLHTLVPEVVETASFKGSLRQLRLVDLIQIKCLSRDHCRLLITGPSGNQGVITISAGAIIQAEAGPLAGIEAFNEILSWKGGFFHEAEFTGGVEINIHGSWEMVLMDAVRRSDECHALVAV